MTYNNVKDIDYSYYCINSSNLFGCCGIRKKQFCILNKQYSKEDYEKMLPRVREHMDAMPYIDAHGRKYRYGEFFPPQVSPFAYNETIALEYFPLTKEEVKEKGCVWREESERDYRVTKEPSELPRKVTETDNSICNEIIRCAHTTQTPKCNHQCTTAFKMTPQELEFYRKMNIPMPKTCPRCRHYERIAERNKIQLREETCNCAGGTSSNSVYTNEAKHTHGGASCPNMFQTTYPKDHKEIVYCETCYQAEVS